jgi:hypothetical protein
MDKNYSFSQNDILLFEYILMDQLNYNLTVYHPYKSLKMFIEGTSSQNQF